MKFLITLLLTLILFFSNTLEAKPRCGLFLDEVYSKKQYPTDEDYTMLTDIKNIGFRVLQEWDNEKSDWKLSRNKNGYLIIGKVLKQSLTSLDENSEDKVLIGDIILSINNEDIRKTYDYKQFGTKISDRYEESEKIQLKLERTLSNGKKKIIEIETNNELSNFDEPLADIFIDYIDVDEKKGVFNVSLELLFTEFLNEQFQITKSAHKYLVQTLGENPEYLQYPSNKDIREYNFSKYECEFGEKEWTGTNTRYPYYYMRVANLVSEDKDKLRKASYIIYPELNFDEGEIIKESVVDFERDTSLLIKNDFNLKSFPFDRQKLKLKLFSEYPMDFQKLSISSWTPQRLEEFKKKNEINGWHIVNAKLSYDLEKKPEQDDYYDAAIIEITLDRKSGYYLFKIIIPIILILMVCWSSVWINPREIESRLTITIVCLLSLIAYNFVIDADMPKLEYLTIMDYIILISYIYATIPNFLSIYSFQMLKKSKPLTQKYELYEKKYGLPSYILIIFLIIIFNITSAPEHTNSMFTWATMR